MNAQQEPKIPEGANSLSLVYIDDHGAVSRREITDRQLVDQLTGLFESGERPSIFETLGAPGSSRFVVALNYPNDPGAIRIEVLPGQACFKRMSDGASIWRVYPDRSVWEALQRFMDINA